METIRSFIAVEIPEQVRSDITRIINRFAREDFSVKWVKHENLHITLLFLGDIDNNFLENSIKALTDISGKEKSFDMSLKGLGAFPSPKSPRVIWIGAETGAKELSSLQEKIETAFTQIGYKPEEKKFHPHLTIGRVRERLSIADKIFTTEFSSPVFIIESLVLFKSTLTPQGPIYEKIKTFPLLKF